jgi:hypothetical protein
MAHEESEANADLGMKYEPWIGQAEPSHLPVRMALRDVFQRPTSEQ